MKILIKCYIDLTHVKHHIYVFINNKWGWKVRQLVCTSIQLTNSRRKNQPLKNFLIKKLSVRLSF